jgi:hypothetical protein
MFLVWFGCVGMAPTRRAEVGARAPSASAGTASPQYPLKVFVSIVRTESIAQALEILRAAY